MKSPYGKDIRSLTSFTEKQITFRAPLKTTSFSDRFQKQAPRTCVISDAVFSIDGILGVLEVPCMKRTCSVPCEFCHNGFLLVIISASLGCFADGFVAHRTSSVGRNVFRLNGNDLCVIGDCLSVILQIYINAGAIHVCAMVCGANFNSVGEISYRLLIIFQHLSVQEAAISICSPILWVNGNRLVVIG